MNRSDMMTAVGMGAMAGMRALSAPTVMSQEMAEDGVEASASPVEQFLSSPVTSRVMPLLAVGEMVMDKMPGTHERMFPPVLLLRLVSGAAVGIAVAKQKEQPVLSFAVVGAAAALASSFALHAVREFATRKLRIPHLIAGLMEDALVATLGKQLAPMIA